MMKVSETVDAKTGKTYTEAVFLSALDLQRQPAFTAWGTVRYSWAMSLRPIT